MNDAANELVRHLNSYEGKDVWSHVLRPHEDRIDWERTQGEPGSDEYGDAITLVDGTVLERDEFGVWHAS